MRDTLLQLWANAIGPALITFMGTVLASLLSVAAVRFTQRTGIQIEASHREALHSALLTGVRVALAKWGHVPMTSDVRAAVIDHAVEYAKLSVPDAIKKLSPPPDVLASIAASKIEPARSETPS